MNDKNANSNPQGTNSNSSATKKTFWPYGILLSLFAIVCACVVTIIYASNYPVYEDDSFLGKYQEVIIISTKFSKKMKPLSANFA